jgi:hypothetical protein
MTRTELEATTATGAGCINKFIAAHVAQNTKIDIDIVERLADRTDQGVVILSRGESAIVSLALRDLALSIDATIPTEKVGAETLMANPEHPVWNRISNTYRRVMKREAAALVASERTQAA